jgi:hypothetical protein
MEGDSQPELTPETSLNQLIQVYSRKQPQTLKGLEDETIVSRPLRHYERKKLMESNNHILDALTREGVLINVSVRYWRATRKLKPEDLGLNPDNVTDRLISLGHKKLLPKEALEGFALIEGRAHSLVEASTFPFLHGLGHFLPNTKLEEVTRKLAKLESEFTQAQNAFVAK